MLIINVSHLIYYSFMCCFYLLYFVADAGTKGTGIQLSQPHPSEKFLVTEAPFKLSLR